MTTEFANIALDRITSSLTNPRKNFNAAKLTELAQSIAASGVHQPILVRPLPGSRMADTERTVQFELVCGERRLRASQQAGVDTIPAMVRALTDEQVLEIQIVENLQRDDLTELEEAEGYEALMDHAHITADQVGSKIGKSRSYVYARLKLLDLCSEARVSLRDGSIDASRALLVARIPDHKLQLKAMQEIVKGNYYGATPQPMTYREAQEHMQHNFMLKLSTAKFDTQCATLYPTAGACQACPKRTGHAPDLFSDVKSADVCIDPPCFHKKEEAHAAALVKAAQDKGQTVIAGKEAQELASSNHYASKFKGYRRLDNVEDSPTGQPLRKIIGKQMLADSIQPTMIENAKGVLVPCLPNDVALRLLKAVEGQAAAAKTVAKEVRELVDNKKAKADAKAKAAYEQDWRDALVQRVWQGIERVEDPCEWFDQSLHRYTALRTASNLSAEQEAKVGKLLGLDKVGLHSALLERIKEAEEPERIHMLMLMVRDSSANDFSYSDRIANEGMLLVAAAILQGDLKAMVKDIQAEALAKHFPKVKEAKAAAAPADSAVPRLKKAKLNTADAQAAIAAAMQGAEAPATNPSQAAPGFAVGQRVRVTTDRLPPRQTKWAGKEGIITGKVGAAWDVTFKGRSGGISSFDVDLIEAVAA